MNDKKLILITIILAGIILFSPMMIRHFSGNSAMLGEESYLTLRTIQERTYWDDMIVGGRPRMLDPFDWVAGILPLTGILPLLGMVSFVIFYLILRNLGLNTTKTLIISLTLLLSPTFIYTFIFFSSFGFMVFLNLLGFYIFISKIRFLRYFSIPILAVCMLFGPVFSISTLILLFSISYYSHRDNKLLLLVVGVMIVTGILNTLFTPSSGPLVHQSADILGSSIAEFGSLQGYGIFILILALVGIKLNWSKKHVPALVALILLGGISFVWKDAIILLNFPVTIAAGLTLLSLINSSWESDFLKKATTLVLICGLLFSTVAYLNRMVTLPPDDNIISSLKWLRQHSKDDDLVLSHYSNGNWIQEVAKRKVLVDSVTQENEDVDLIFYSRNLQMTKKLLDRNHISFIWIDPQMRSGEVWKTDNEGLLFLFSNNETFSRIYEKEGIEIWNYTA